MLNKYKQFFSFNVAALTAVFSMNGATLSFADDISPSTDQNVPQTQNPQNPQLPQNQPPQNPQNQPQGGQGAHKDKKMAFKLGVCVGQSLASDGIMIQWPQPGQRPNLDETTKAALKAAIKECAIKFIGPGASPSPGPDTSTSDAGAAHSPDEISIVFSDL